MTDPNRVPPEFYAAVSAEMGEPFAYSYLTGARCLNKVLLPRTQTAWMRLRERQEFTHLMVAEGYTMRKPPPFRPATPSHDRAA